MPGLKWAIGPEITFIPSDEWQWVRIPAAGADTTAESPDTQTWQLQIRIAGFSGDYSLDIDEIKFY